MFHFHAPLSLQLNNLLLKNITLPQHIPIICIWNINRLFCCQEWCSGSTWRQRWFLEASCCKDVTEQAASGWTGMASRVCHELLACFWKHVRLFDRAACKRMLSNDLRWFTAKFESFFMTVLFRVYHSTVPDNTGQTSIQTSPDKLLVMLHSTEHPTAFECLRCWIRNGLSVLWSLVLVGVEGYSFWSSPLNVSVCDL